MRERTKDVPVQSRCRFGFTKQLTQSTPSKHKTGAPETRMCKNAYRIKSLQHQINKSNIVFLVFSQSLQQIHAAEATLSFTAGAHAVAAVHFISPAPSHHPPVSSEPTSESISSLTTLCCGDFIVLRAADPEALLSFTIAGASSRQSPVGSRLFCEGSLNYSITRHTLLCLELGE